MPLFFYFLYFYFEGGAMEWLGAATLGYGVSDTIRTGVADLTDPTCWACGFCDSKMGLYSIGILLYNIIIHCFVLLLLLKHFSIAVLTV